MRKADVVLGEGCHLRVGRLLPSFKWNPLALLRCMHAMPGHIFVGSWAGTLFWAACEQMWSRGAGCGEAQALGCGFLSLGTRVRHSSNWRCKWNEGPLDLEQGGPLELLSFTAEGLPLDIALRIGWGLRQAGDLGEGRCLERDAHARNFSSSRESRTETGNHYLFVMSERCFQTIKKT